MHRALRGARPLVFAHRGGAKLGPENTIAAFTRGLAAGADGLELDVRLSKDRQAVVIHDSTVDRTTDARGRVDQFTAAELSRMDVLRSGAGVPRLGEVLERFSDAAVIVEVKETRVELVDAVVALVLDSHALDRVVLGSFHTAAVRAARRREPRLPTGSSIGETRLALYASYVGIAPFWAGYRAFQIPERTRGTRVVSKRFIRLAHEAGLVVQVWTVDDPSDMRRLLSWGADALITDRPDVAVEIVGGRVPSLK